MVTDQLILAHDIGTSGNKATLFNQHGQKIASEISHYQTFYLKNNWVEQDANDWWNAVCKTSKSLIKKAKISPKKIVCVTFSGQMMGVVAVDKNVNALRNAIIWADMRAEKEVEKVLHKYSLEELYHLTGNRISPSYSAAKISWIKTNEKNIYSQTFKFLQAKDFLVAKLTGTFATDYSDASGTNLLNIHTKDWSNKLISAFQIDEEKLPSIFQSTAIAGTVHRAAAEETGLHEGTSVVLGGADAACAALGAGVLQDGDVFNYIGTSSWITVASNQPLLDKKMRTFNFIHLDEGMYIPTGTMQSAGSAFEWVKEQFYKEILLEKNKVNIYERMNNEASLSPIGANGLMFLPYLLGERSPWWNQNARGGFVGLSIKHNRNDFVRATLEGISLNLKIILDTFRENGKNINDLWLFGGGANSRFWCQMLADIFKASVRVPYEVDETTSMGAAIAGGVGVGLLSDFVAAKDWCKEKYIYKTKRENGEKYEFLLKKFTETYEALEPIYDKWN